jgi:hypothetical protein
MMVKILTGGPLSEITRSLYKQVRLLSTTNPDTLERVHEIFSEDSESYFPIANPNLTGYEGASNPLDDNKLTLISIVKNDYEILRRAFNRLSFMETNPLLFDSNNLRSARDEYESAKKKLSFDSQSAVLSMVLGKVEEFLAIDRHLLIPSR